MWINFCIILCSLKGSFPRCSISSLLQRQAWRFCWWRNRVTEMWSSDSEHRFRSTGSRPRLFLPHHIAWTASNTGQSWPQTGLSSLETSGYLQCFLRSHLPGTCQYIKTQPCSITGFWILSVAATYTVISSFSFSKSYQDEHNTKVFLKTLFGRIFNLAIVLPKNLVVKSYNSLLTNNLY